MAGSTPDVLAVASSGNARDADAGARATNGHAAKAGPRYDPRQYVLILRFALVNIIGIAGLIVAYFHGFIDAVRSGDDTHICDLIFAVFLAGLYVSAFRVFQVSRELNAARNFDPSVASEAARYIGKISASDPEGRGILAGVMRLRLGSRITLVRHIAGTLVLLGLIGTVVGFIISLSGIDPQKASEIASISPMVSILLKGMSTALFATVSGSVLNIWLMANYRLLSTGTVKLVTTITELGERHGRN